MKTFAFRVDASLDIGTGHVMRCLTLADELRAQGAECHFISREHPGHLIDLVRQRGHVVSSLPAALPESFIPAAHHPMVDEAGYSDWLGSSWQTDAQQTSAVLAGLRPDWLVVDHYAIDVRWESALKDSCHQLLVIDDLADRPHQCHMLLDQNWFADQTACRYDSLVPTHCVKLLGPKYALLKPEYAQLRQWMPLRDGIVRRVLVFMGGSDPTNQTAKVLQALMASDLAMLAVDVVIGVNHSDPRGIRALATARPATALHQDLPSLAGLMVRADLMIGAGGSTTWERTSLGLPTIAISIAANQTVPNQALAAAGYIQFMGEMAKISVDDIAEAVRRSLNSPALLKRQAEQMQALVSGDGASQLCRSLLSKRW